MGDDGDQMSIAIGIVKTVDDQGGAPRVKLQFPWLDPDYRTDWVRIAAPMAGDGRGIYFMPETEDVAVVGFDRGNLDNPYIVGFLWAGSAKPPESDRKIRAIHTQGGHIIRLEDGDPKRITIETPGGLSIVMDDSASGSITISGGGRKLAMTGGKIQIT